MGQKDLFLETFFFCLGWNGIGPTGYLSLEAAELPALSLGVFGLLLLVNERDSCLALSDDFPERTEAWLVCCPQAVGKAG